MIASARAGAADPPRWLLVVVGNALPLAAFATGSLSLIEALLSFLLEVPIAGLAYAAKVAVVRQPDEDVLATVKLAVDRDWLAAPVRVTRWNVRHAGSALVFVTVASAVLSAFALVIAALFTGIADAGLLRTVSPTTVGLATVGLLLAYASDVWRFLVDPRHRNVPYDALTDRYASDVVRLCVVLLVLPALLFEVTSSLGRQWAFLGSFAATKTALDLWFQARRDAPT